MAKIYFNEHTTPAQIKRVTVARLVKNAPIIFQYCAPRTIEEALVRVWTTGTTNDARDYLANQYNVLKSLLKKTKHLNVCAGLPETLVEDAINRAVVRISKVWKARSKKRGKTQ